MYNNCSFSPRSSSISSMTSHLLFSAEISVALWMPSVVASSLSKFTTSSALSGRFPCFQRSEIACKFSTVTSCVSADACAGKPALRKHFFTVSGRIFFLAWWIQLTASRTLICLTRWEKLVQVLILANKWLQYKLPIKGFKCINYTLIYRLCNWSCVGGKIGYLHIRRMLLHVAYLLCPWRKIRVNGSKNFHASTVALEINACYVLLIK